MYRQIRPTTKRVIADSTRVAVDFAVRRTLCTMINKSGKEISTLLGRRTELRAKNTRLVSNDLASMSGISPMRSSSEFSGRLRGQ